MQSVGLGTAGEIVISVQHVDFAYDGRPVLEDCSLEVTAGEFLGLIGPNGGGKTTLLRLMLGELSPRAGSVSIFGLPATELGRRRSLIGYVPQRETLDWDFPATALDVVVMGAFGSLGIGRRVGQDVREQGRRVLKMLGVPDIADRPISKLSGGQQQRIFVARALIAQPRLLLLDEPTTGVDIGGIEAFFSQIRELKQRLDLTVIMASHDVQHLRHVADKLACIRRSIHWHERADAISDERLTSVEDICELDAYLTHRRTYHRSEGESHDL